MADVFDVPETYTIVTSLGRQRNSRLNQSVSSHRFSSIPTHHLGITVYLARRL
jgi:hypothetical protein